jgi:hypothetical protein
MGSETRRSRSTGTSCLEAERGQTELHMQKDPVGTAGARHGQGEATQGSLMTSYSCESVSHVEVFSAPVSHRFSRQDLIETKHFVTNDRRKASCGSLEPATDAAGGQARRRRSTAMPEPFAPLLTQFC